MNNTLIAIAIALCLLLLLSACNQPPLSTLEPAHQNEQYESIDDSNKEESAPNFQGIADALGCVFAPQSCKK